MQTDSSEKVVMKKRKELTWVEAAKLVLQRHSATPMSHKEILKVIDAEQLKEISGTTPLACLNAMLHAYSHGPSSIFYKVAGRMGVYGLKNDLPGGAVLLEMEEEQTTELNLDEHGEPLDGQPHKECVTAERKKQKVYYAKLPPGVKTIPPPPPQKTMDATLQESVENRLAHQINKATNDAHKKDVSGSNSASPKSAAPLRRSLRTKYKKNKGFPRIIMKLATRPSDAEANKNNKLLSSSVPASSLPSSAHRVNSIAQVPAPRDNSPFVPASLLPTPAVASSVNSAAPKSTLPVTTATSVAAAASSLNATQSAALAKVAVPKHAATVVPPRNIVTALRSSAVANTRSQTNLKGADEKSGTSKHVEDKCTPQNAEVASDGDHERAPASAGSKRLGASKEEPTSTTSWVHRRRYRRSSGSSQSEVTVDLETPNSVLVHTNLRNLVNRHTLVSLPQSYQYQLIQMLPEVERLECAGNPKSLSSSSLNNEFLARALQDWKERLAEGEFMPENKQKLKQEGEKDLVKLDPWKQKHFEPVWGERCASRQYDPKEFSSPSKAYIKGSSKPGGQKSKMVLDRKSPARAAVKKSSRIAAAMMKKRAVLKGCKRTFEDRTIDVEPAVTADSDALVAISEPEVAAAVEPPVSASVTDVIVGEVEPCVPELEIAAEVLPSVEKRESPVPPKRDLEERVCLDEESASSYKRPREEESSDETVEVQLVGEMPQAPAPVIQAQVPVTSATPPVPVPAAVAAPMVRAATAQEKPRAPYLAPSTRVYPTMLRPQRVIGQTRTLAQIKAQTKAKLAARGQAHAGGGSPTTQALLQQHIMNKQCPAGRGGGGSGPGGGGGKPGGGAGGGGGGTDGVNLERSYQICEAVLKSSGGRNTAVLLSKNKKPVELMETAEGGEGDAPVAGGEGDAPAAGGEGDAPAPGGEGDAPAPGGCEAPTSRVAAGNAECDRAEAVPAAASYCTVVTTSQCQPEPTQQLMYQHSGFGGATAGATPLGPPPPVLQGTPPQPLLIAGGQVQVTSLPSGVGGGNPALGLDDLNQRYYLLTSSGGEHHHYAKPADANPQRAASAPPGRGALATAAVSRCASADNAKIVTVGAPQAGVVAAAAPENGDVDADGLGGLLSNGNEVVQAVNLVQGNTVTQGMLVGSVFIPCNISAAVQQQQMVLPGAAEREAVSDCACNLKPMHTCRNCGAFCHDDCIGPSKLCVTCLIR
ncbi:PREDICTED: putative Polycomb group protein ASXL2 [Priapulus caudatus]|uniref:Polycomb group protein ASXL2 n=1 Tax=Priapulus caudatus TaxID=37621 RepID=A0ABM1E1R7_PRICU|nr:PREDICTED: putative Polycomb group protein ASXL2 [Priapulus caudatus]